MTPTETQHGLSSTRIHHACRSGYKSWFKTARAGLRWWSIHVPQFLSSLVWQRKIEQKKKKERRLLHLDISPQWQVEILKWRWCCCSHRKFPHESVNCSTTRGRGVLVPCVCDPFPIPCMPPWINNWRVHVMKKASVWLEFDQTPHTPMEKSQLPNPSVEA